MNSLFFIKSLLGCIFCSLILFPVSAQMRSKTYYNNNAFKTDLRGPVKSQKLTVVIPTGVKNLRNVGVECYILEEQYNPAQYRMVENLSNIENVLIAKSEILHNRNGFATEVIYTDLFGNMMNRITYAYNKKQNWKQAVNYDAYYNPLEIYDYSYTSKGEISEIKKTNEEGIVLEREIFAYDSLGNLIEQTLYDKKGNQASTTEFLYNQKGNVISYRTFFKEDSLGIFYEANFQGDTLLTDATIEYYQNNKPRSSTQYLYDPLGNILETTETDLIGNKPKVITKYLYEWDLWGNWTKQLIKKNGDVEVAASRSITYYEN